MNTSEDGDARPAGGVFDWEPEAAAEYNGDRECQYGECDNTAEWVVEWSEISGGYTGGKVCLCCEDCSRKNLIHVRPNELYKVSITDDGIECLPEDIVEDTEFEEADDAE